MTSTNLSLGRRLSDVVDEYENKLSQLDGFIFDLKNKISEIPGITTVGGTYSGMSLDFKLYVPQKSEFELSLLKSAWRNIYDGLMIERRCSPKDKQRFQTFFEKPIPLNIANIREVFGDYILNPRENILRGLAEVFSGLDPSFKSHDKMKIGVKGLPKRVIIQNYGQSRWSSGADAITSILNALAMVQEFPLVEYAEMEILRKDGNAVMEGGEFKNPNFSIHIKDSKETITIPPRGVKMKYFDNGNAHMFFSPETLKLVNKCLAEYYGDVLPDCYDEEDRPKRRESTEVSKDLQYYPTPKTVVDDVLDYHISWFEGKKFLEPSCGCGRFLDAIKKKGGDVFGIEFDHNRVNECRQKGHAVLQANFLEVVPEPIYDYVVMNPPFYGKHYMKHIRHAMKFLVEGGMLVCVLPATAKYDHGLIDTEFPLGKYSRNWRDLPVGSFKESGTNINTGIFYTIKT